MMRSLHLSLLAGSAAILGACGSSGVRSVGGDVFMLETANVSGARAVDTGLAEAQNFCVEHGRLFVMTNSLVSADRYQMQFRCISPGNMLPPIAVAAPSPPPPTTRRQRQTAEAPRVVRGRRAETETAMSSGALLPPMAVPAWTGASFAPPPGGFIPVFQPQFSQSPFAPSPFAQPVAFGPLGSGLPPVSTTPLFAPAPGASLNVAPLASPRLPAADGSALTALPRAEAVSVISSPVSSGQGLSAMAPQVGVQPRAGFGQALPPVETLPLFQGQAAMPAQAFTAAQAFTPAQAFVPAQSMPLSAPPSSFGMAVPSQNPLPGASNSLPPIAGGSTRPLALPGNVSSGSAAPPGFWQQGR